MARRMIAFLIDWCLVFVICPGLFMLGPRFDMQYLMYPSVKMFSAYGVIAGVLGFLLLPIFRDVICGGASIGKRIAGLRVVDRESGNKASVEQLLLRNLLFYFVAVDAIVILYRYKTIGKEASLGDEIAKTDIVYRGK